MNFKYFTMIFLCLIEANYLIAMDEDSPSGSNQNPDLSCSSEPRFVCKKIDPDLDPRVHFMQMIGQLPDTLHVILKINDLEAWECLGIKSGCIIPIPENTWILTARLTVDQLHHIRKQSFLVSYEHSQKLHQL